MANQYKRQIEIKDWEKLSAIGRYATLKANGYEGAELLYAQGRIITDNLLRKKNEDKMIELAAKEFVEMVNELTK